MSKVVKLEDAVYQDLDQLRSKGDTFSGVIKRLLILNVACRGLRDLIGDPGNGAAEEGIDDQGRV